MGGNTFIILHGDRSDQPAASNETLATQLSIRRDEKLEMHSPGAWCVHSHGIQQVAAVVSPATSPAVAMQQVLTISSGQVREEFETMVKLGLV